MKKIEEEVKIEAIYVGDYYDMVKRIQENRDKLDELVDGYNEIMEKSDKRDEGIRKLAEQIKHDLYDGEGKSK